MPRCQSRSAPGTYSRLAVAPVAMITVRAATVAPLSVVTVYGGALRSTALTVSVTMRAPLRSDCRRIRSISSGPPMPSGKPG